ncbi:MAG: YfaZ family outer membrane protein [Sideroxyarcus sp.]|nr:YfaZ family outer membrane protein [Sideroxyarcus sp.]
MFMLRRFIAVGLLLGSSVTLADTLDINLSNSAAQFKYGVPSGIAGKSSLFASLLYNDANDVLVDGGLLVLNEEGGVPGLSLGIGAKVVAASLNKVAPSRKFVSGVALGAQVRFEIPTDRRFAVIGEYHYAPGIISFGGADNFSQSAIRGEFAISPLTQAYIGYRESRFKLANGLPDGKLDSGVHIGVRLAF